MRLGDLDALEKRMNERLNFLRKAYGEHDDYVRGFDEGCVAVENAPTIDPESLRPKGYKEPIGYDEVYTMFFKCRVCGCEDLTAASNYCPNCGADMRGNLNA